MGNKLRILVLVVLLVFKANAQCGTDATGYGSIVISEVYFDTQYNEAIGAKYHNLGEYIELYNSSDQVVDLSGWTIKDNHTSFTFQSTASSINSHQNLKIAPGGYKIITYDGFYAYGRDGVHGGASSAIGGREKFIELFPEATLHMQDIILQDRMVLYNDVDKVSLYNPSGRLISEVSYLNNTDAGVASYFRNNTEPLDFLKVASYTVIVTPPIQNIGDRYLDEDGRQVSFNYPIGKVPELDPITRNVIFENGMPKLLNRDEDYKQAIYLTTANSGYYSNHGALGYQRAIATPFTLPYTITAQPIDPLLFYPPDIYTESNFTESISYDLKGVEIENGHSRTYFDNLGKPTVSISKDFVANKFWGSEILYDAFGRKHKESFPAITCFEFNKVKFFKTQFQSDNLTPNVIVGPIRKNDDIRAITSITAYDIICGNIKFTSPKITLEPGFKFNSICGGFKATSATPDLAPNSNVTNFYSDSNTQEPYQATAEQPYSEIKYDTLNPGNVINVVGGNKINNDWKTGYSYTVPAAQEMYYVYGSHYYEGPTDSNGEEVITKFYKSVSVDANGIENVAFTDGEGKVLASARSGDSTKPSYPVVSVIGTQGFVDVHIPAGIPSGQIELLGNNLNLYKIYNLKTGSVVNASNLIGGNAYRIEALTPPTTDPKVYISAAGVPKSETNALGIKYNVNYYDYSVNVYNKTGQLIKSIQPKGYATNTTNATIVGTPPYLNSGDFTSTYAYNDQGQIKETTSPDEGTSKFAYRQDGQIRYSQSALQKPLKKVSYTNYDSYARPIESGVISSTSTTLWDDALDGADAIAVIQGTPSERTFTVYDDTANTTTVPTAQIPTPYSITIPSYQSLAILAPTYIQNNLAGNVAVTYKADSGTTITAITWYSYDIYGRSEWMVQYNEGIGAKTIDYDYDYKGNVQKVLYQKGNLNELFVHQYTYDNNNVLKKVETSTDNIATNFITQADYTYYLTGELKRTHLVQAGQGLDYVYTLGGALKSINHPSLDPTKDPGKDGSGSPNAAVNPDVFGITLDYYSGDYKRAGTNIITSANVSGNNQDFIGNIKAARWANKNTAMDWNGINTINQKGYLYTYNRNNFLTDATFGDITNTTTAQITAATKYKEGSLTYDANGNIITLQRANAAGDLQDKLSYSYNNNNQLNSVDDDSQIPDTLTDVDIKTQFPGNYGYDAIGQMTSNVQEGLYYSYNTQGLVTEVRKAPTPGFSPIVRFYYNERGHRIRKESYVGGVLNNTTYYSLDLSGNMMAAYYNLPNTTTFVQTELPIYGLSRLGVYAKNSSSSYEITDHLGNVRAVITKQPSGTTTTMTSYADYYPFGEQLPGRNSRSGAAYRYAFQGQELDPETGMEAFQLRLWDGRIGRWLSPDPYGEFHSPYLGMGNNPVSTIDPDGGCTTCPNNGKAGDTYNHSEWGTLTSDGKGSWSSSQFGTILDDVSIAGKSNGFYAIPFANLSPDFNTQAGATFAFGGRYNDSYARISGFGGSFSNYSTPTSLDFRGEVYGLKGEGRLQFTGDYGGVAVHGKATVFEANARLDGGILSGTKIGATYGAKAGASVFKATGGQEYYLLGAKIKTAASVSFITAEWGIHVHAYYDKLSGNIEFEGLENLGLGVGAGVKISGSIPFRNWSNYLNK